MSNRIGPEGVGLRAVVLLGKLKGRLDRSRKLGYFWIMIRINVHEAKTHLSRYLKRLEQGETILLCRHNVPIAEIRPLARSPRKPRPIGLAKGEFEVPAAFDAPLPDWLLGAFDGGRR